MTEDALPLPAAPASAATRWPYFVAGGVAVAVAIAVGEIVAGVLPGAPSLVVSIGTLAIDLQPPGAKDLVVSLFGTNDKLALNVLILILAVAFGGFLGLAARQRFATAVTGFFALAVVALYASLRMGIDSPPLSVATVVLALAAALGSLRLLVGTARGGASDVTTGEAALATPPSARQARRLTRMPDWGRRRFLVQSGTLAIGSVVVGSVGRSLLQSSHSQEPPATVLPGSALSPAPLGQAASLPVEGISPIVIANDDFYRIDTALVVPRVDVAKWSVKVSGMVDRELDLTYQQLTALPIFEQYVTIACVSNEVGGNLVGNALWRGVRLRDVLAMAGVKDGATQIVGRSVDGFTVGFPTEWAMDPSRDPMVAVGMNGAPLPVEHGFPARLIVPGLFGYVSATKWLAEIELTTLQAFDAYWVPLGWAKEAPILTQSRIDVPHNGAGVAVGPVVVAGVAWAPDRGIAGVEVRVDDGTWLPATLSAPISKSTWVQWRVGWDAAAGDHTIEVRATDGLGVTQTDEQSPPAPDGARGHHTIRVRAS